MSLFRKKKTYEVNTSTNTRKTTSKTSKAEYRVEIKEAFGKGTTTLKTISCKREIDQDDHVVYLSNITEKFLELMPEDENDLQKLDIKEIERKLNIAKSSLKKEKTKDDPNVNEKNFQYTIMKLEAQKRALSYSKDNAYLTIDHDGVKKFTFLRKGSTFYPFKWDIDTRTIYVTSENVKKKAGMARRNKQIKYSKFKNVIEGSVMFMMILNVILAIALGYTALKMFSKFDESKIVEAQNFCVQKGAEWTAIIEKNAKASEAIFKQIQDKTGVDNPFLDNFVPASVEGTS